MAKKVPNLTNVLDQGFAKFLLELSSEIEKTAKKNLRDGVDFEGKGFEELRPATERDRKRQGYSAKRPILIRTGKLRDSLKAKPNTIKQSVTLTSSLKYADNLNDGVHSKKWGRRNIEGVTFPRRFLYIPKELDVGGSKRKKLLSKYDEIISEEVTRLVEEVIGENIV